MLACVLEGLQNFQNIHNLLSSLSLLGISYIRIILKSIRVFNRSLGVANIVGGVFIIF